MAANSDELSIWYMRNELINVWVSVVSRWDVPKVYTEGAT